MNIKENELYKEEYDLNEIYEKLSIAQEQIEKGEVNDSDFVFSELKKKYKYEI